MPPPEPFRLVLMYHAIVDGDPPPADPGDRAYAVTLDEFRRDLDALLASPFPVLDGAALAPFPDSGVERDPADPYDRSGSAGVLLTFDDSWRSHESVAARELKARDLPACFFLTTAQIGRPGMLTWEEVRRLAGGGFALGAHGVTHRFLADLPAEELRAELEESRARLQTETGREIRMLSLPGGRGGRREAEAAARAGYALVFGSRPGLWRAAEAAPLPRIAVRPGGKGRRLVRALLRDPANACRPLALRHAVLAAAKRALGNRLYHALHGRLRGRRAGGEETRP